MVMVVGDAGFVQSSATCRLDTPHQTCLAKSRQCRVHGLGRHGLQASVGRLNDFVGPEVTAPFVKQRKHRQTLSGDPEACAAEFTQ